MSSTCVDKTFHALKICRQIPNPQFTGQGLLINSLTSPLPSASSILGMSKYFSAMSNARLRFSTGLSYRRSCKMHNQVSH